MTVQINQELLSMIDQQRNTNGFLSVSELLSLGERKNIVFDPFSVLISSGVKIGHKNIFYPNTIIEIRDNGAISISDSNVFYPNSLVLAERGIIEIGNNNQFGDGGISVKANYSTSKIIINNFGRYMNGVQLIGCCYLGSGSQIIGNITAQDCHLEDGESFAHPDATVRGGVLKGSGIARNLIVPAGMVINGLGTFQQDNMQSQSYYHPNKE